MRFQCEMAGVEEADDSVGNVALEGFGTGRQEERIVLAPDGKERWPLRPEVVVKSGIERYVTCIVEEQVELNLVVAGPRQQSIVERVGLRCDQCLIRHTVDVLPFRGLGPQEFADGIAISGARLLPILPDWSLAGTQAFFVRVAGLRGDRT